PSLPNQLCSRKVASKACMTKPRKSGKASNWFFYLVLTAGLYTIMAGGGPAQEISVVSAQRVAAGLEPVAGGVGGFHQDGDQDLAVVNRGSTNISVLLGNGNGTFQTGGNYQIGRIDVECSIVVSDFNGDSILDLAVGENGPGLWIFLGNGNGTFRPTMSTVVP